MPLILSSNFSILCRNADIYLDTNVFICAQDQPLVVDLIAQLQKEQSTGFVTLSSVEYEFTRGSHSLEEIKFRREFVRSIVDRVLPVGKLLESDKNDAFSAAMSTVVGSKNSQYTDYLLAVALYVYRNGINKQFVLSADVKAFPMALFDIQGVVTISRKANEITHLHLLSLNNAKYADKLVSLEK
jgi:hypothetical protein